jgi:hypothetical protein
MGVVKKGSQQGTLSVQVEGVGGRGCSVGAHVSSLLLRRKGSNGVYISFGVYMSAGSSLVLALSLSPLLACSTTMPSQTRKSTASHGAAPAKRSRASRNATRVDTPPRPINHAGAPDAVPGLSKKKPKKAELEVMLADLQAKYVQLQGASASLSA